MRERSFFTSDLSVNEFLLVKAGGLRAARPRHRQLDLPHRLPAVGAWKPEPGDGRPDPGDVPRPRARDDAHGGGGRPARRRRRSSPCGSTSAATSGAATSPSSSRSAPPCATRDGELHRAPNGRPFTSDLSGQDFWTLLSAGYRPLGLVMGTCVYHVAHQGCSAAGCARSASNAEMPNFTQALYDARELAMERMQAEAEALEAEGIVGVAAARAQPRLGLARHRVLRDRHGGRPRRARTTRSRRRASC